MSDVLIGHTDTFPAALFGDRSAAIHQGISTFLFSHAFILPGLSEFSVIKYICREIRLPFPEVKRQLSTIRVGYRQDRLHQQEFGWHEGAEAGKASFSSVPRLMPEGLPLFNNSLALCTVCFRTILFFIFCKYFLE